MLKKILLILVLSVITVLLIDYFIGTADIKIYTPSQATKPTVEEPQPILEYGIPIDSFYVTEFTVKRNQTLGKILYGLNIPADVNAFLLSLTPDVFDVKKVRTGARYKIFSRKDSLQSPAYLVYEVSPVEFFVFNLTDSLYVYPFKKNIIPVRKISEAEIRTSLWVDMKANGLNPVLALELSDIFAWTVDFFGLFKGDRFRVMYDELYVDSTSIGIGTIYAAWFEHRGERFYAFRFEQDSVASYWDEKGNSLRKSFLKAPLRFSRISSRFSGNRFHPVLKIYRPHSGVDYAAPEGTPVMAVGDGVVIDMGYNKAAGNYIKIRHNSVYTTGYNHFSRFAKGMAKGVRVKQGDIIGYVGKTGYATGPHLDFRVWMNGSAIDPLKMKSPPVEPVKQENLEAFRYVVAHFSVQLDSIIPGSKTYFAAQKE
ncbi:MAG TPA: metalloendopeptidase [Bacteroidales bacterium]|nr:metalloendopeptidase [Bacteroidales bacterium]